MKWSGYSLSIYDAKGSRRIRRFVAGNPALIDLGPLSAGWYGVEMIGAGQRVSRKIVMEP